MSKKKSTKISRSSKKVLSVNLDRRSGQRVREKNSLGNRQKIGLIGSGLMGKPMGSNWLKEGYELFVLPHSSRAPIEELVAEGAIETSSLKDMVLRSDVVILMLPTGDEVSEICLGTGGLLGLMNSKQIVIDMTTSDSNVSRDIYEKFLRKNLRFFDAPVTGGVWGAKAGSLTLFVGGPEEWLDETKVLLSAVSQKQVHFGAIGSGNNAKIVNNLICIANIAVLAEALPLGKKYGLNPKKLFTTLAGGTAASKMLEVYGPMILKGDFAPRFKISHALKDMKLAKSLTKNMDYPFHILNGILELFKDYKEGGFGELNVSGLIRAVEAHLDVEFRS